MAKIMNMTEGKDALVSTAKGILDKLTKYDFSYNINCYFSGLDLSSFGEDATDAANLIVLEAEITHPATDEKIILEGAVAIDEGQVLNDEIIREADKLKKSVQDILSALEETSDIKAAVLSLMPKEEKPEPRPSFDNKAYYIGGIIIAAIITFVLIIMNK